MGAVWTPALFLASAHATSSRSPAPWLSPARHSALVPALVAHLPPPAQQPSTALLSLPTGARLERAAPAPRSREALRRVLRQRTGADLADGHDERAAGAKLDERPIELRAAVERPAGPVGEHLDALGRFQDVGVGGSETVVYWTSRTLIVQLRDTCSVATLQLYCGYKGDGREGRGA